MSDAVKVSAKVIASCEGEQYKFEEWAKSQGYDMEEHPLHYLFMDQRTDAARQGWKAALAYVRKESWATTTKLRWGFKSRNQLPLFMVWREYYQHGEVVHADVVFNTRDWLRV